MTDKPTKLMVCGHGRHGKDEFCNLLGLPFTSSSRVALDKVIYPVIGHLYKDPDHCFRERSKVRRMWFDMIANYNRHDLTRLARDIYSTNDVYCGIRSKAEFLQAKEEGLFDISFWIDASLRLPPEPVESNQITADMCDVVVYNNGTLEQFHETVEWYKNRYDLGNNATTTEEKT